MRKRLIMAALAAGLMLAPFGAAQAAKLYISEYSAATVIGGWSIQIAEETSLDQTPVDYTGGQVQSAALQNSTIIVRLVCDTQCSVKFGTNPAATNANKLLPALVPEYFAVTPGQAIKISVVSNP